ncbi:MAG: DNA-directed RNA polymerase subunit H [Candidatus Micrarchaeota archaeon]|nr:DNA-directed RNA polymerase subunit H [Candidatus Micrarchaeota archaeon]
MSHELVPGFKVLTKKEKADVLDRYGASEDNLPKILEADPVVKVLKAKTGDVLEITRKSPTAGETKYYRIVVGKIVLPEVEGASEEEPEEEETELEAPSEPEEEE